MEQGWYIPPFWAGVMATVGVEIGLLIVAVVVTMVRKRREKRTG